MAQVTDFNIGANPSGFDMRTELNSIIGAITTENSGASEPLSPFAFMKWIDTSNATYYYIKERNHTNDAWVSLWRYTVATKVIEPLNGGNPITFDLASAIHSATTKATPVDADELALSDSAATFGLKKLTWENLKATILISFGVMINTATAKATPVDADMFILADSAATNATKKVTWLNFKTVLKTYFDTLYMALAGNQDIAGIKTFSSSPIVPTPTTDYQASTKLYVDSLNTTWVANDSRAKTALNASGTAPIYACRAWVNFNGTGTVAIRASGNVSSITDNGVGDYTVNFTTAMVDANYSVSTQSSYLAAASQANQQNIVSLSTTSINFRNVGDGTSIVDRDYNNVIVFR